MNVAALLLVLLNWLLFVFGPLTTLHAPVPTLGEFAAKVAVPVVQIVCGEPAFDVVGLAFTVIAAVLLALIAFEQLPDARFVTVTVVEPLLARAEVVKVPVPAEDTVMVAVLPVAVFGALKLYVTV